MRAVVGYVRVSTEGQAQEGISLEEQRARITAWVDAAATTRRLVGLYEDAGITGTRTDGRPGLHAALAAVCRSRAILVVVSLSRLARSTRDAIDIASRLEKADADLVSLSEAIDTATAHGRFLFALLAGLAQMEAEIVAERTVAAMAHLRRQRRRISGHVPFGWVVNGTVLEPEPAEQAIIAMIRAHRAEGRHWSAIAAALNADRVPTKRGGHWRGDAVKSIVARFLAITPPDDAAASPRPPTTAAAGDSHVAHSFLQS